MPKHGFLTPKAISNRIKARGLSKLKWYCQMCSKQCRDENGFKCHKLSESHQRKMKLFIAAPKKFMNDFSREFDHGFMQILRLKGGRRVKANDVYTDYIANRQHVHMNATVWSTLTGYVMHLGKSGKAKVERAENEEKGKYPVWYITYIDRDPERIEEQKRIKKMKKMEERERRMESEKIQRLIEQNQKNNKLKGNDYKISELQKDESNKINFGFRKLEKTEIETMDNENNECIENVKDKLSNDQVYKRENLKKRKLSNLEALIEENEHKKRRLNESEYINDDDKMWLMKGIVVKIKKGEYDGKKGIVLEVERKSGDKIKGIIKVLKCGKDGIVIKMKQKYLETVVPSFGRSVMILKGKYRNSIGILQSLSQSKFCGDVEVDLGNRNKKLLSIPYENFSKMAK